MPVVSHGRLRVCNPPLWPQLTDDYWFTETAFLFQFLFGLSLLQYALTLIDITALTYLFVGEFQSVVSLSLLQQIYNRVTMSTEAFKFQSLYGLSSLQPCPGRLTKRRSKQSFNPSVAFRYLNSTESPFSSAPQAKCSLSLTFGYFKDQRLCHALLYY